MVAGIVLILAGIMMVVYPPLLSIIVATFMILAGVMAISIARFNRKNQRPLRQPDRRVLFQVLML